MQYTEVLIARMESKVTQLLQLVCDLFSGSVTSTFLILQETAVVFTSHSTSKRKWIYWGEGGGRESLMIALYFSQKPFFLLCLGRGGQRNGHKVVGAAGTADMVVTLSILPKEQHKHDIQSNVRYCVNGSLAKEEDMLKESQVLGTKAN